jgi:hypothetical protein
MTRRCYKRFVIAVQVYVLLACGLWAWLVYRMWKMGML